VALVKPIRKWTGTPKEYFSYCPERLSDKSLLTRARAEIKPDFASGRDVIAFQDQAQMETMWITLIHDTRRLLTFLLPALRELAEGENFHLRMHAARILGRLGEIDPLTITFPVIASWAASASPRWQQATAGYLYQGVLSSKKQAYKDKCLARLEEMGQSEDQDQVWTTIAAYKQIGVLDLSFALDKLGTIAEKKLAPHLAQTNEIARVLRQIEQEFKERKPNPKQALQLIVAHELLEEWGLAIMEGQEPILFAMQYAIVALCLVNDPMRVFQQLRKWLRGTEGLRGVMCLFYLESEGIADELSKWEEEPEQTTAPGEKSKPSNPVIVGLASDAQAPARFAEFLEDIFANFNTVFPLQAARYLREAFFNRLVVWVAGATEFPKGLKALEDVFVRLLTSPISDLKRQTLDLLRTDEVFLKEGSREKEFAARVLKRGLTESPGRAAQTVALAAANP
ncbi:MAG TPA: hypothetical protein VI685_21070, partial [Candidatus Angelobacter sp.]